MHRITTILLASMLGIGSLAAADSAQDTTQERACTQTRQQLRDGQGPHGHGQGKGENGHGKGQGENGHGQGKGENGKGQGKGQKQRRQARDGQGPHGDNRRQEAGDTCSKKTDN